MLDCSHPRGGAAAARFEEALAIQRRGLGDGHRDVGTTLNNLGRLLRRAGRHEESESRFLEALDVYRDALGAQHFWVNIVLVNLADLYLDTDRLADAEATLLAALAIVDAGPPSPAQTRRIVERLVDTYERGQREDDAATWREPLTDDASG